jgi:hypothetical protein
MNIQTVAENLRNTIAGKEELLAHKKEYSIYATEIQVAVHDATVEFLKINIGELKRILQDIEQCEPSLPGEGNNYENW